MNDHDEILAAFLEMAAECDESVSACDRSGWTNIHGPLRPASLAESRCFTHRCCIQKCNGSVTFHSELGRRLGAELRPNVPIKVHPLGYTHRALGHRYGLTADDIRKRWITYREFAHQVRTVCKQAGLW